MYVQLAARVQLSAGCTENKDPENEDPENEDPENEDPENEDSENEDPENKDPEPESKLNGIHSPTLEIRVRGFHTAILSTVHEKRKGRKESVSLLSAMLCNTAGRLAPVACSLAAAQARAAAVAVVNIW